MYCFKVLKTYKPFFGTEEVMLDRSVRCGGHHTNLKGWMGSSTWLLFFATQTNIVWHHC